MQMYEHHFVTYMVSCIYMLLSILYIMCSVFGWSYWALHAHFLWRFLNIGLHFKKKFFFKKLYNIKYLELGQTWHIVRKPRFCSAKTIKSSVFEEKGDRYASFYFLVVSCLLLSAQIIIESRFHESKICFRREKKLESNILKAIFTLRQHSIEVNW